MKGFFVTGTDTDIGKTIFATALTLKLKGQYWKPVQSGTAEQTDSQFAQKILGSDKVLPETYKLTPPLSPNHAAAIDGVQIDFDRINLPTNLSTPLIVEGVGGIMVPLNERHLVIDLIKKFDLPCILVAKSTLGTLNHTLLSLEALRSRAVEVLGVVLNGPKNWRNKESIERFGQVKVIGEMEKIENLSAENLLNSLEQLSERDFTKK